MEDDLKQNGRQPHKKWKTTSKKKKMEDNLKKMEDGLQTKGRRPQKKWKKTSSTIKKINLNWL
jgi:hypothetical protein